MKFLLTVDIGSTEFIHKIKLGMSIFQKSLLVKPTFC